MNRWKRWVSAALSLTLLAGLLPAAAWAAENGSHLEDTVGGASVIERTTLEGNF